VSRGDIRSGSVSTRESGRVAGNLGQGRQTDSSSLASAAAALIAVGVLHPREAEQLLDQFDLEWDVDFARSRPG